MANKEPYLDVNKQTDDKWSVINWDKLDEDSVKSIVLDRFNYSSGHPKRVEREQEWKDAYSYWLGDYGSKPTNTISDLKNMTLFSTILGKLAKMYRMMFHYEPIIRVYPDNRSTSTEQADKVQLFFHHQIQEENPRYKFSLWLLYGMLYGINIIKVGYYKEEKVVIKRRMIEGVRRLFKETVVNKKPFFEIPNPFDIYPDMDARDPSEISYVIEVKKMRLSRLLNSKDIYINLEKVVDLTAQKFNKKDKTFVEEKLTTPLNSSNAYDKSAEKDNNTIDNYDPIVDLKIYYEANRIVVIANDAVVIRNEESPFWKKEIPFIFSPHYLVPNSPYGIGDVEMAEPLQEAEDIMTQFAYKYGKQGLKSKLLVPENATIDEEGLIDEDSSIVYAENPDMVKELQLPTFNLRAALALIQEYKSRQEEITAMTAWQKGAPIKMLTAKGEYRMQEQGNMRFLYNVDQYEPAIQKLAEWMQSLNYQYMDDEVEIKKKDQYGNDDWIIITPDDLDGKFKYVFTGSANAEDKELRYNKILQLYPMFVNRTDIDQNYLLESLVKASNAFDNPEKLINVPNMPQGQDRIRPEAEPQGMTGGVRIPQGSPEEMQRQTISDINNPMNRFNGGLK